MPVRRFASTTNFMTFGIGTQSVAAGFTYVMFLKRFSNAERGFAELKTSAAAQSAGYWVRTTGGEASLRLNGTGTEYSTAVNQGPLEADGWVIYAWAAKSTSGIPPWRSHKYVVSTKTFTHANVGSAEAHVWNSIAGGSMKIGNSEGVAADFDLAADAFFNTQLSDAEFESLCNLSSISQWATKSPVTLREFKQASVSESVSDVMGNGANQSGRTGTEVRSEEPPIPYSVEEEEKGILTKKLSMSSSSPHIRYRKL